MEQKATVSKKKKMEPKAVKVVKSRPGKKLKTTARQRKIAAANNPPRN